MAVRGASMHTRWFRVAAVVVLLAALIALPLAALAGSRPRVVPLPTGWQPEGIATKHEGPIFFSGSLATGAIFRGNLRTGEGRVFIPGVPGRVAVGMKVRDGMLFVAGGPTGQAYVFDARGGREIGTFQLTTQSSFINDVAVTREAAWFTDSFNQQLYKLPIHGKGRFGQVRTLPLTGDISFTPGQFNANGIDFARRGKWLIIVQSNTGELFRVNPHTGRTVMIDVDETSFVSGDGILLDEHRLWVVQNTGLVSLVNLFKDFRKGRVIGTTTDDSFDVPTTVAESGRYLAIINSRFSNPSPTTADYWVTQIPQSSLHDHD